MSDTNLWSQRGGQHVPHRRGDKGLLSPNPTSKELNEMQVVSLSDLPARYTRAAPSRVFTNRSLRLDRIEWIGFDMDYTLAVYTEELDRLIYDLAVQRLLETGFPPTIASFRYDPSFPIRGLLLDQQLGNLLKIDEFGQITRVVHGRRILPKREFYALYPTGIVPRESMGARFYLLDTLFAVPEACLYADLVQHLESDAECRDIVFGEHSQLSFEHLFNDVRQTIDYVHQKGELKARTLKDLGKYVDKSERAPVLLRRLKRAGKRLFLLTNSPYAYTDRMMRYLFDDARDELYPTYLELFDVVTVDARKPRYFKEGTPLREVDSRTGKMFLHSISKLKSGSVYSGGSLALFNKLTGASGTTTLYIGDHIFGDVLAPKRATAVRTLLVVRELRHEVEVWQSRRYQELRTNLKNLELIRAEMYRGLDSSSVAPPDATAVRTKIRELGREMDRCYSPVFGSIWRSGSKITFLANQVMRYADLYASDYANLIEYPPFYFFYAQSVGLPHECEEDVPPEGRALTFDGDD